MTNEHMPEKILEHLRAFPDVDLTAYEIGRSIYRRYGVGLYPVQACRKLVITNQVIATWRPGRGTRNPVMQYRHKPADFGPICPLCGHHGGGA